MARTHLERRNQLLEKLVWQVAGMRESQRAYFRSRKPVDMQVSIEREKVVDATIAEIKTVTAYARSENPAQAGLFD